MISVLPFIYLCKTPCTYIPNATVCSWSALLRVRIHVKIRCFPTAGVSPKMCTVQYNLNTQKITLPEWRQKASSCDDTRWNGSILSAAWGLQMNRCLNYFAVELLQWRAKLKYIAHSPNQELHNYILDTYIQETSSTRFQV